MRDFNDPTGKFDFKEFGPISDFLRIIKSLFDFCTTELEATKCQSALRLNRQHDFDL